MESEKIYRLENASITKALRVTFVQGDGTKERPCRLMWRFYLPDGRYIGEIPADGQDDTKPAASSAVKEKPMMRVIIKGRVTDDVKRIIAEMNRAYGDSHTLYIEVTF